MDYRKALIYCMAWEALTLTSTHFWQRSSAGHRKQYKRRTGLLSHSGSQWNPWGCSCTGQKSAWPHLSGAAACTYWSDLWRGCSRGTWVRSKGCRLLFYMITASKLDHTGQWWWEPSTTKRRGQCQVTSGNVQGTGCKLGHALISMEIDCCLVNTIEI